MPSQSHSSTQATQQHAAAPQSITEPTYFFDAGYMHADGVAPEDEDAKPTRSRSVDWHITAILRLRSMEPLDAGSSERGVLFGSL